MSIVGAGTIILPENIHNKVGKVTLIFADSHVSFLSINNLLSYCGLIDARIRASDKDLPVQSEL